MLEPVIDDDGAPFFEYAARGELRMQTCGDCGEVRFPPRPMCPHCQSTASEWKLMSGHGTVWSFAVPHPPLLPDYAAVAPYPVVVVELAEDRRLDLERRPRRGQPGVRLGDGHDGPRLGGLRHWGSLPEISCSWKVISVQECAILTALTLGLQAL